jgi:membrane protein YqaA with SNARE-associated domain
MTFTQFARRIYDGVIHLSANKHAVFWLFVVAFVESSFFPIPPDIMLIPMILATPKKAWKLAFVATMGSVIGAYLGYAIGCLCFDLIAVPILDFYGVMNKFNEFKELYHQYGAWIVFAAGITPFPYKIITIASGVVHLNLVVFTIASIIARGLRFYLIAALLYKFGEPMKIFIEKNLGWLSILFLVLLIGGFMLIKLF